MQGRAAGPDLLDSSSPPDSLFIPMADTAVAIAERTLPHNLEAERSVLGAILVHNDAFNSAIAGHHAGGLLPRRAPPHLRQDGRAQRAQPGDRLRHAEGRTVARRRARRRRRPGLHRLAGRRRAARDQHRVLRAHRQGEGDAPQPDLRREQDRHQRLRGGPGSGPDPRRGRERDLLGRRRSAQGRLRADARSGQGELPEDRAAVRAEAADHRRADRLRRSRRDDARPAGRATWSSSRRGRRWARPAWC